MSQIRKAEAPENGAVLTFDDLFSGEAIDDLQIAGKDDKLRGHKRVANKGSGSEASSLKLGEMQDFALAA